MKFKMLKTGDLKMSRAPNKTQHIVIDAGIHNQIKIYCKNHKMSIKTFVEMVLMSHIETQLILEVKAEDV